MNYEEMTRRIEAIDGNILRNMIQDKVLPEDILTEYFKVKTVLDRVSGAFVPSTLAMIVLKCQERMTDGYVDNVKVHSEALSATEVKHDAGPETEEIAKTQETEKKPELEPETKPEEVKYVPAKPEPEETEKWPEGAYKKGTMVTAFLGGAMTDAEIVNAYYSDEQNSEGLTYQVEIEGTDDPVAVPAEDVELKED